MSAATSARRREPPAAVARLLQPGRWPDLVMAVACVVAFALILYVGRHLTTFLFDEWNIVLNRRGWDLDTILRPHNEHLVAVPVLIFKLMFETVGAAPYWPYRVVVALAAVAVAALVYVYAARRIGKPAALVPGLLTVLVGAAGQDLIWPFQIAFVLSTLGGVAMLLCLDRATPKAEWWAGGFVLLALASSGVGLAVLAGALVDVAARPGRRARALRILALPVVLYGLWYVPYNATNLKRENLDVASQYAIDASGGAVGALVGLSGNYYVPLALVLLAVIAWAWLRPGPAPLRLATIATVPYAFWLLTGVGRADGMQPTTSRYLLPGAIFVALIACEALRGVRLPSRAAVLGVVLVAFASWSHVFGLRDEARGQFDGFTAHVRAELAALELARQAGPIDPAVRPDPGRAPDITVGKYFEAVDDLGAPIPDPSRTIAESFLDSRESADATYFSALAVRVRPGGQAAPGGPAPTVAGGPARPGGRGCIVVRGGRAGVVVVLPPAGLALRTAGRGRAAVGLRRWGTQFVYVNALDPGAWRSLAVGHDSDPAPVQVVVRGPHDVRVCSAR